MAVARRWLVVGAALALVLAFEGAFLAGVPFSLLHVLVVPALYAGRWTPAALAGLALADWGLGRIPLGASLSTVVSVGFVAWLVRDDVNRESPWLAAAVLPGAELLRRFWTTVFAQLYDLPPAPSISFAEIAIEAAVGVVLMRVLLGRRREQRAQDGATVW